jgi:hypothetical protein
VSRNKLCMSTNFIIFGPMDQKLWMLKFLGRVWSGRACAIANQQELTTCAKSGGQEKKRKRKKGLHGLSKCRPAVGGLVEARRLDPDCWSPTSGRRPKAGWRPAIARQPWIDTWNLYLSNYGQIKVLK